MNKILALLPREKEARGLDKMENSLALSSALGQHKFGFLSPVFYTSTTSPKRELEQPCATLAPLLHPSFFMAFAIIWVV